MPQGTPERPNVGPAATKPDPAVAPFDRLPFAIDSARLSTAARVLLLVPTLGMMLAPAVWLAATATPALRAAADNPLAAIQVVVGLGLWAALFIVPARRLLLRFGSQRSIRIAGGIVAVRDRAILRARVWQGPLNEFSGIAYRERSSLSGVRHELHLVHIDPGKSLLLHGADAISEATIAAASSLLGLPLLPAVARHRLGVRAGRWPLVSLWRSLWAHPLRIGLTRWVWPARRRHPWQRSVG